MPNTQPAKRQPKPTNVASAELAARAEQPAFDPSTLVPSDAFAYVQLASTEAFDECARKQVSELVKALMGDKASPLRIDTAAMVGKLLELQNDAALIDVTRPLGIAWSFDPVGEPKPTFILPVRDTSAYLRALQTSLYLPRPFVREGYVAVSLAPTYARTESTPAIARDLGDATLVVRLDLELVRKRVGSEIVSHLRAITQQLSRGGARSMHENPAAYVQGVRFSEYLATTLMYESDALELRLESVERALVLSATLHPRVGGSLDGLASGGAVDWKRRARALPEATSFTLLSSLGSAFRTKLLSTWIAGVEAEVNALGIELDGAALAQDLAGLGAMLDGPLASWIDARARGSHLAHYFQCEDPERLAAELERTLSPAVLAKLHLSAAPWKRASTGGVELRELCLPIVGNETERFAAELVLGKPELCARLAWRANDAVLGLGGNDPWFQTLLPRLSGEIANPIPLALQVGIEQLGASNPAFIAQLDLGALLDCTEQLEVQLEAHRTGTNPDHSASPFGQRRTLHPGSAFGAFGGISATEWKLGFVFDPGPIADALRTARESRATGPKLEFKTAGRAPATQPN